MTPSTKCPKCGAEKGHLGFLLCGSRKTVIGFDQSDSCRDRENTTLRASLAKAVEALKPFAKRFEDYEERNATRYALVMHAHKDHFRRASSVLKEISKDL